MIEHVQICINAGPQQMLLVHVLCQTCRACKVCSKPWRSSTIQACNRMGQLKSRNSADALHLFQL